MNIKNSLGLCCEFLGNGALKCIQVDPIRISLKAGTPFSKPGTNLYLRKRGTPFEFAALLGPESRSHFGGADGIFFAKGSWAGLDYTCVLELSKRSLSWRWIVDINNHAVQPAELD